MFCLRCGKETHEEQAFCLECQKDMRRYPVDPGPVVQLPPRKQPTVRKTGKRRITPEEQVRSLRKRVRNYACMLLAALMIIICLTVALILNLGDERSQIGKNYTTVKPTVTASEPG